MFEFQVWQWCTHILKSSDSTRRNCVDQEPLCAAITETYEVAFCEHHHVCTYSISAILRNHRFSSI